MIKSIIIIVGGFFIIGNKIFFWFDRIIKYICMYICSVDLIGFWLVIM